MARDKCLDHLIDLARDIRTEHDGLERRRELIDRAARRWRERAAAWTAAREAIAAEQPCTVVGCPCNGTDEEARTP